MGRLKGDDRVLYEEIGELDAAGMQMKGVLCGQMNIHSWCINMGMWGSYLPLLKTASEGMGWAEHVMYAKSQLTYLDGLLERGMNKHQANNKRVYMGDRPQTSEDIAVIRECLAKINTSIPVPVGYNSSKQV